MLLVTEAHDLDSGLTTSNSESPCFIGGIGLLYLLGMHLTLPNVGGIGLVLPFNAFAWLFFAIPLGIGLYYVANRGRVSVSRESAWLALAALLVTVPVFYPHAFPLDAVLRLAGVWTGLFFFLLLQQFVVNPSHKMWLLTVIAIGVTFQALLGYLQYLILSPGNLLNYAASDFRPVGVFQQPNVMASFLATGLAISAYGTVRPVWHETTSNQSRRTFLLLAVLALPVLTLPLLVVLSSRTGWLAASMVVVLTVPYAMHKQHRGRLAAWLLSVAIGVALGVALAQFSGQNENVTGRMAAKATTADSARQDMYRQSFDMFREAPLIGHGLGRFESAYVLFGARQRVIDPDYPAASPNTSHPHNELLFWLVEGGVIAFFGLVIIAGVAARLIWQQPNGQRLSGLLLLAPIALHSQLEHPFYMSAVHWLTLIIFLACLAQSRVASNRSFVLTVAVQKLARVSSLVVPVVIAFFMITTLHTNNVLNEFQHQEYRELDDLNRVSNAFVWRDRIDWLYYYSGLYIGVTTDTPEYIQPYIDWSDDILARKPRPQLMQGLIIAHEQLGQDQEALAVLAQVRQWFPAWSGVNLKQDMELDTEISPENLEY